MAARESGTLVCNESLQMVGIQRRHHSFASARVVADSFPHSLARGACHRPIDLSRVPRAAASCGNRVKARPRTARPSPRSGRTQPPPGRCPSRCRQLHHHHQQQHSNPPTVALLAAIPPPPAVDEQQQPDRKAVVVVPSSSSSLDSNKSSPLCPTCRLQPWRTVPCHHRHEN